MPDVTFQVLDGVDRGRTFSDLSTPLTIGREEGNPIRLNDERVSRFHAKVQRDQGDFILTDLESTNGTRVNGDIVQIRRLRAGDRVTIGRTVLLFGSEQEIADRLAAITSARAQEQEVLSDSKIRGQESGPLPPTLNSAGLGLMGNGEEVGCDFEMNDVTEQFGGPMLQGQGALPPLPRRLSPSQAARLAELLDYLHRGLAAVGDHIHAPEAGDHITVEFGAWQRVQAVQMLLARYLRAVTEPGEMRE